MKLTGELKEKFEKVENKEEAKQNVEDAGVILDDSELDQISGGVVDGIDGVSMSESFREFRK